MSNRPDPDLTALLALALAMAPLVPSAEAAPHACLEWRVARRQWLAAAERLGFTEHQLRSCGAAFHQDARRLALAESEPRGEA
ncbi:MAG TPA: hypothetical protein VL358_04675 [Caulobacteraceae bacterium]|jgi:hypothetical protein|nr:hypothetical protein [Caulobacteraceae bacterium]